MSGVKIDGLFVKDLLVLVPYKLKIIRFSKTMDLETNIIKYMKSKIECPYCDGIAVLNSESREITYKEKLFAVKSYYYKCEVCREEFTTTETDSLTMMQVFTL